MKNFLGYALAVAWVGYFVFAGPWLLSQRDWFLACACPVLAAALIFSTIKYINWRLK